MRFSQRFVERLKTAYTVTVLTGAGVSAASGVPTFRGKDGLWNKYRPEELANRDAFLQQPDMVWKWYRWRRSLIKNVRPNLAHYALVDLSRYFPEFNIITQNVDGLHGTAGSQKVVELHGNIMESKCIDCNYRAPDTDSLPDDVVPRCPGCQGLMRPDVVWFGEMLPRAALERAQEAAAAAEIFFAVGTSSTVEPAASLPYMAKGNGALIVEINPDETPLSPVADERLPLGAHKVLPVIAMAVEKLCKQSGTA